MKNVICKIVLILCFNVAGFAFASHDKPGALDFSFDVGSDPGQATSYAFNVYTPGRIQVTAQWLGNAPELAVFLSGPGNASYLARIDGSSPLILNFYVSEKYLHFGTSWRVTVLNLSGFGGAEGLVYIKHPVPAPPVIPEFSGFTVIHEHSPNCGHYYFYGYWYEKPLIHVHNFWCGHFSGGPGWGGFKVEPGINIDVNVAINNNNSDEGDSDNPDNISNDEQDGDDEQPDEENNEQESEKVDLGPDPIEINEEENNNMGPDNIEVDAENKGPKVEGLEPFSGSNGKDAGDDKQKEDGKADDKAGDDFADPANNMGPNGIEVDAEKKGAKVEGEKPVSGIDGNKTGDDQNIDIGPDPEVNPKNEGAKAGGEKPSSGEELGVDAKSEPKSSGSGSPYEGPELVGSDDLGKPSGAGTARIGDAQSGRGQNNGKKKIDLSPGASNVKGLIKKQPPLTQIPIETTGRPFKTPAPWPTDSVKTRPREPVESWRQDSIKSRPIPQQTMPQRQSSIVKAQPAANTSVKRGTSKRKSNTREIINDPSVYQSPVGSYVPSSAPRYNTGYSAMNSSNSSARYNNRNSYVNSYENQPTRVHVVNRMREPR